MEKIYQFLRKQKFQIATSTQEEREEYLHNCIIGRELCLEVISIKTISKKYLLHSMILNVFAMTICVFQDMKAIFCLNLFCFFHNIKMYIDNTKKIKKLREDLNYFDNLIELFKDYFTDEYIEESRRVFVSKIEGERPVEFKKKKK